MKTLFFICLFLICTLSNAQTKKGGYFSIALGANFQTAPDQDPIIGGHLSGNAELGKGAYLGLEVGVVKFQLYQGVYIPIQAKFTLLPMKDKKVSPLIVLSPGLGAYNKTVFGVSTTGGFVFYGGLGAAFSDAKKKSRAFITVGYSLFGFNVNDQDANIETIGIRAGVMLH